MKYVKKVVLWTLLASLFLAQFVLYTPSPSLETNHFSAVRALEHIEVISREPHSVFDPVAHETVRQYIVDTLTDYVGASNVTEYHYDALAVNPAIDYPIDNVLGVIPGESETGIMLVGHYDSRGHIGRFGELGRSYGAADDGYAVGTMLEFAYLYKDANPQNSIYFLFTDGEETGLFGAHMATQEEELMSKVGFLINIEARGISGPAIMFETSSQNEKVIEFYQKANLPVSYSLATAVYAVMPNYTDFTEFLAIDKNGINFAVLEGLDHYHSPLDNYQEVSVSSIQHYGEQIEPLVTAFSTNSAYSDVNYFNGTQNYVFFTLFSNVFISYSETVANIMHILVLVLLIAVIFLLVKKSQINLKKIGHYTLRFFGVLVIAVVVGYIFARVMALFGHTPYKITYVRMNGSEIPSLLFMVGITVLLYYYYQKKVTTKENQLAFLLVGTSFQLLLALLTGFTLSGASFLFFVPAFFGLLVFGAEFVNNKPFKHVFYGISTLISALLIIPILYAFFLALTVGGMPILVLLLIIHLSTAIPIFKLHYDL